MTSSVLEAAGAVTLDLGRQGILAVSVDELLPRRV